MRGAGPAPGRRQGRRGRDPAVVARRPAASTERRRDDRRGPGARAGRGAAPSATSPRPAASTTSTRSTRWRCSTGAPTRGTTPRPPSAVERLRWQTRSIKWVAYTLLALVIVVVLVAGVVGWWYIHQINPAGDAGDPVSFTVERRRHAASRSASAWRSRASSRTPACSAGTRTTTAGSS